MTEIPNKKSIALQKIVSLDEDDSNLNKLISTIRELQQSISQAKNQNIFKKSAYKTLEFSTQSIEKSNSEYQRNFNDNTDWRLSIISQPETKSATKIKESIQELKQNYYENRQERNPEQFESVKSQLKEKKAEVVLLKQENLQQKIMISQLEEEKKKNNTLYKNMNQSTKEMIQEKLITSNFKDNTEKQVFEEITQKLRELQEIRNIYKHQHRLSANPVDCSKQLLKFWKDNNPLLFNTVKYLEDIKNNTMTNKNLILYSTDYVPHFIDVVGAMKEKLESLTGQSSISTIIKPSIQFSQQLSRLKSQLAKKQNQITSLQIQQRSLRQNIQKSNKEIQRNFEQMNTENKNLKKQIQRFKLDIRLLQAKIYTLKENISTLKSEKEAIQKNLKQLKQSNQVA